MLIKNTKERKGNAAHHTTIFSHQHPPFRKRFTVYLQVALASSVVWLLTAVAFLTFHWFSSDSNVIWWNTIISSRFTRSVTLLSLLLRGGGGGDSDMKPDTDIKRELKARGIPRERYQIVARREDYVVGLTPILK